MCALLHKLWAICANIMVTGELGDIDGEVVNCHQIISWSSGLLYLPSYDTLFKDQQHDIATSQTAGFDNCVLWSEQKNVNGGFFLFTGSIYYC